MSIWLIVILKGVNALVDGVSFLDTAVTDPVTSGSAKADRGRVAAAELQPPSAGLKTLLAGRLGDTLTVRINQVLSPEKLLLDFAGSEVIARGSAPPGTTGLLTVRLESIDPFIQLSLLATDTEALPQSMRRILSDVVAKPNIFSENIAALKELLQDKTLPLPLASRNLLGNLTSRFSISTLLGNLRGGAGLALDKLGLLHEPELVTLLLHGTEKQVRQAVGREPLSVKESLLRLLADLDTGQLAESLAKAGSRTQSLSDKLRSTLHSLKDMVELNQTLNNPGLRSDMDLLLLLPLWSGESFSDLWLRLSRDEKSNRSADSNLYTLMIYLDFAELGPLGAQLVVGSRELQAKFFVVGEDAARNLRKLLPEVRNSLRADFSEGLHLQVETVGSDAVAAFRQRAFLASMPPLLTVAG